MQVSSDHTHPRWRFTSHRRLKNVIVVLDWVPSVDATAAGAEAATAAGTAGRPAAGEAPLTDGQRERLQRVFEMYDAAKLGAVGEEHPNLNPNPNPNPTPNP